MWSPIGYVGRVLTATMIGCALNWGAAIDRAYQTDRTNGANLLTITGGHQIDALCYCLDEFRELTAFAVSQRDRILVESTGEMVSKDVPDRLSSSAASSATERWFCFRYAAARPVVPRSCSRSTATTAISR
jgi:predicted dehydrogenase